MVGTLMPHLLPLAGLAVAVLVFYWVPLTADQASIHWDAVDVHYSAWKYFADTIWTGKLPSWTPYIFSGFPFLSDPQNGVWYPLNWPLFLLGVEPRGIQLSLAVHGFIAACGTYLLALRFVAHRGAASLAGILYAFSGFFAGHSSHVGMFQTAALLPWLLLALERGSVGGAGAIIGMMILAGHFQTALYCCFAALLYIAVRRLRPIMLAAFVIGALISCIQVIPGFELVRNSVRSRQTFTKSTNAALEPSALATLVSADALGAVSGSYKGPEDITQFYFYAGLALLPLALLGGWRNVAIRWTGLALLLPTLWYALGPPGGLYSLISLLPGFASIRAPVHIWFVPALALALLAGAGLQWMSERPKFAYLAPAVLAFCFIDVFYWNSLANPLAYERMSFAARYGQGLDIVRTEIAPRMEPLTRLHLPPTTTTFGPMNHALDARIEATYGYNPLQLERYSDYLAAAESNPKLLDTLGARYRAVSGQIVESPNVLPRVTFPKRAMTGDAKAELAQLDPTPDTAATAAISEYGEKAFRVHYKTETQRLLRVGMAYFPGWRATVNGQPLDVIPVDYALTGVMVPAGEHDLAMEFHTPGLLLGASLTLAGVIACAVMMRFHA
jgi:hypothetical protein